MAKPKRKAGRKKCGTCLELRKRLDDSERERMAADVSFDQIRERLVGQRESLYSEKWKLQSEVELLAHAILSDKSGFCRQVHELQGVVRMYRELTSKLSRELTEITVERDQAIQQFDRLHKILAPRIDRMEVAIRIRTTPRWKVLWALMSGNK